MKRIISILLISVLLLTSFPDAPASLPIRLRTRKCCWEKARCFLSRNDRNFLRAAGKHLFHLIRLCFPLKRSLLRERICLPGLLRDRRYLLRRLGHLLKARRWDRAAPPKQDPAARRVPARKAVLLRPVKVPVPAATPAMNIGRCGFPIWIFPECSKGRDSRLFEKISERPFKMCRIWDAMW